jgi:hypothetical protein
MNTRSFNKCLSSRYVLTTIFIFAAVFATGLLNSSGQGRDNESESQIANGFAVAPVPLNLQGKNRSLVGRGSYLINAVSTCNDCHTWPNYTATGNPFAGQPKAINTTGYMAGGRPFVLPFGTVVSRNITPDALGRPGGLSFSDFREIMRTGIDDDAVPPNVPSLQHDLLQVMPWPNFGNMTDNDLRAMYEYLSAIPCIATAAGANGEPPAHSCTP